MASILCFPTSTKTWVVSSESWALPDNLFLIDMLLGGVFFPTNPETSDIQQYYNYIPDISTVLPSGTVINGIVLHYYSAQEVIQSSNFFDFNSSLGFDGSGPLGVIKTTNIELFTGAPIDFDEGGAADFWGLPFTPISDNFGASFASFTGIDFFGPGNAVSAIDAVALEFFYDGSTSTPRYINSKYYGTHE